MKIAIGHNSLNKFGGGEKVALTMADELSKRGHIISIYTLERPMVREIEAFYGIDIEKINFCNDCYFSKRINLYNIYHYGDYILSKILSRLRGFDAVIDTSSNGFYPINNKNAKTICYVHFPMGIKPSNTLEKLYLLPIYSKIGHYYGNYDKIIANSNFTKEYVKKITSRKVDIIYPPVSLRHQNRDVGRLIEKKTDSIITVGRFTPEKKLVFLVNQFKKIYKNNKLWQMDIVGSSSNRKYSTEIKEIAKGYPIFIHDRPSQKDLYDMYARAKIYWHARGYDETNPVMFENFGITTVEAMNHGCIPIVINKGGQKEIVDHRINGFKWDSEDELYAYTKMAMNEETDVMAKAAIKKSNQFDENIFRREISKLLEGVL